jgi:hypothetical protein
MTEPDPPSTLRRGWEPYDPTWLVALARVQHPDSPWLAESLARCTQAIGAGRACVHFASPHPAVAADGSAAETIQLDDPDVGVVVVEVLPDRRIGGIEIVALLD